MRKLNCRIIFTIFIEKQLNHRLTHTHFDSFKIKQCYREMTRKLISWMKRPLSWNNLWYFAVFVIFFLPRNSPLRSHRSACVRYRGFPCNPCEWQINPLGHFTVRQWTFAALATSIPFFTVWNLRKSHQSQSLWSLKTDPKSRCCIKVHKFLMTISRCNCMGVSKDFSHESHGCTLWRKEVEKKNHHSNVIVLQSLQTFFFLFFFFEKASAQKK